MYLRCCSPQCLQFAQDQAAVRRQSRYVNGDSAAGQAGILTQPLACSRRTVKWFFFFLFYFFIFFIFLAYMRHGGMRHQVSQIVQGHLQPCFYQLALLSHAWLDHASGIRRITISTLQPSRCLNRFSCLPYCLQNVCFRYYHAPLFTLLPMCCSRLDYADVQACYSFTHMLSACAHTSAVSSGNACEASQGVQPPNTLQEYVSKTYYLFVLTATVDTSC